MSTVEYTISKE